MKKTSKKSLLPLIIKAVALVLGIATICMAFMPFITRTGYAANSITSQLSLSGFDMAFGKTKVTGIDGDFPNWIVFFRDGISSTTTDFAAGTITYKLNPFTGVLIQMIVALLALVLVLISMLFKGKKSKKIGALFLVFAGLCFIAAGIMAFFPVNLGGYSTSITETLGLKTGVEYSSGTGALLFAIFGLASGVVSFIGGLVSCSK